MQDVIFVNGSGSARTVPANPGETVMRAAVRAGVAGIEASCGGACSCATCHVYVQAPWLAMLPAMGDEERAMLEFTEAPRTAASRLGCQIRLSADLHGMKVRVPAT